jgi:glyoxylase-like metal-dependent hydrolase (beta-lactamase superfamily II)
MSAYEVHALRYAKSGRRDVRENFLNLDPSMDLHDAETPLDYFVWLIEGEGRAILVDTGFNEAAAAARKRTLLVNPAEALSRFGVEPDAIQDVVITHLHYDHAGNLDRFPNARFHIQDREMAYATGRHMCHRALRTPFAVEDVVHMVRHVYAERVVFHDGEAEIAPGVTLHRVGGHSDGLQVVRVPTRRGPVVIASDAVHLYANMSRQNPFPIVFHLGDMLEGWRTLERLAGSPERVVPGHDPRVTEIYPTARRGIGEAWALHEDPTG